MDQNLRTIRIDARPDHVERTLQDPALLALIREGWRPLPIPLVMEMGNPDAGESRPVLLLILCPPVRSLNQIPLVHKTEPPEPAPAAPLPRTRLRWPIWMLPALLLIGNFIGMVFLLLRG